MSSRDSRLRSRGVVAGLVLAILTLATPSLVVAADVTVSEIPSKGWIQGGDNSPGLDAVIVESPEAGLGDDSVELTTETATSDFVGIGRAGLVAGPLSDITGGSWMTYATGDSGLLDAEPASLRFGMFRLGTTEFTTMTVERVYNATVTAGVWQTTTLDDDTLVYQTNSDGDFCLVDPFTPCRFEDFKAAYPDAVVLTLQVAIGSGIPVTTSYVDGVSLTVGGETDTWDFELAAAAPPPTQRPAGASQPSTDAAAPATGSRTFDGWAFITFGVVTALALVLVGRRRSRPTG